MLIDLMLQDAYRENNRIICVDFIWEVWVYSGKLLLVDSESRVAPRRRASEGELHNVSNEYVPKARLYAVWEILQSRDLEFAVLIFVSSRERQGEGFYWLGDRACLEVLMDVGGLVVLRVELEWQRLLTNEWTDAIRHGGTEWASVCHGRIEQASVGHGRTERASIGHGWTERASV